MPAGRPTKMTPEVQRAILDKIATGWSLVKTLKSDPRFPTYSGFMEWMANNKEFSDRYTKAKEEQADYLAEEINDIADEVSALEKDGHDAVRVNAARLRVDTRKWTASKLRPMKYGERVQHAGDAQSPLAFTFSISKTYEK